MSFQSNCPQCHAQFNTDFESGSAVCECGYVENQSLTKVYQKRDRSMIKVYAATSLVIIGLYMHLMSWGAYAVQIPFLKTSQMLGIASPKTYQVLVEACKRQNKWSCVQSTYLSWYKSTGDVETIASLAQFRTQLKDYAGAAKAYESYFNIGGKSPSNAVRYAQILERNNDLDGALKFLNQSLQGTSPDKLPAFAMGEIVRILIKQQKLAEARATILGFWATAENAKGYFNTEMNAINKLIGPMKVAHR